MPETTHELITVTYLRWIVLLPLIGSIINGLGGALIQKEAGKRAISFIACAPVLLAFALSVRGLMQLVGLEAEDRLLLDRLFTWIAVGNLHVDVAFQLDQLSAVMILELPSRYIEGLVNGHACVAVYALRFAVL